MILVATKHGMTKIFSPLFLIADPDPDFNAAPDPVPDPGIYDQN
jgi:hypothetical protein